MLLDLENEDNPKHEENPKIQPAPKKLGNPKLRPPQNEDNTKN